MALYNMNAHYKCILGLVDLSVTIIYYTIYYSYTSKILLNNQKS